MVKKFSFKILIIRLKHLLATLQLQVTLWNERLQLFIFKSFLSPWHSTLIHKQPLDILSKNDSIFIFMCAGRKVISKSKSPKKSETWPLITTCSHDNSEVIRTILNLFYCFLSKEVTFTQRFIGIWSKHIIGLVLSLQFFQWKLS